LIRIKASDSQQSDADERFAAEVFSFVKHMLEEERDDGKQADPAPEDTRVQAGFGADSEEARGQSANNIPIVEIMKRWNFSESIKWIERRNSGSGCRLDKWYAH
jgi:hypothetical protein